MSDGFARLGPDGFERLAAEVQTPFYLYDLERLRARARRFKRAFGARVRIFYALKANPCSAILAALSGEVDGIDVASGGELETALRAGWSAAEIGFAGPGKTDRELGAAIEAEVGAISVESIAELERIAASAGGRRPNVVLRLLLPEPLQAFAAPIGAPSPFGIDPDELELAIDAVGTRAERIRFRGIHVHAGSQCTSVRAFSRAFEATFALAARIVSAGLELERIDLGGGFGIAQSDGAKELAPEELAPELERRAIAGPELILEPGRWIVADAGLYVARVVSIKQSRGVSFAILDGGMNHFLGASLAFGGRSRPRPALLNLSRPDAELGSWTIAGPLCTPLDVFAQHAELPSPRVGDLIAVTKAGAYGLTMSPLAFLGHPPPKEVVLDGDRIEVVSASRS